MSSLDSRPIVGLTWARGTGSTLPGKNKYPVAGKPLIYYSLTSLSKSNTVDEHYVFTEDDDIANIVLDIGWKVIPRPQSLLSYSQKSFSMDKAWECIARYILKDQGIDVPSTFKSWLGVYLNSFAITFSLNCNNAMLLPSTYKGMLSLLKEKQLTKITPAVLVNEDLYLGMEDNSLYPLWGMQGLNRQLYPALYKTLGNTFFSSVFNFKDGQHNLSYYPIKDVEGLDVHDQDDIDFMEYYLEKHPDYFSQ
jgi:hypothetical protein